ncbi:MAG: hypothetical protein ACXWUL_01065, partial [Caldimonas sp.]
MTAAAALVAVSIAAPTAGDVAGSADIGATAGASGDDAAGADAAGTACVAPTVDVPIGSSGTISSAT